MPTAVNLSPSQQEAVNAPWKNQVNMVLASAGSGKTLVLSLRAIRIAKELLNQNARNNRLLCICFNQSMADEMHHRISKLVHEQHLSADIAITRTSYSVSRGITIEVRTFHGLGRYILNCSTEQDRNVVNIPSGYLNVLYGPNLMKLYFQALKRNGILKHEETERSSRKKIYEILEYFDSYKGKLFDKLCESYLLQNLNYDEQQLKISNYEKEFNIYQSLLYERGVIDYGDMIMKSVRLLLSSKNISNFLKSRYASILVDEFQDVSASQLILCKVAIEESKSLTLVGDDDQQIYSWRTSHNWFCHTAVKHVFPSLRTIVLPENRRCNANIVRAAYAVISNNQGRAPKVIRPVKSNGFPVQVVGCMSLDMEKQFVLHYVQKLMKHIQRKNRNDRILLLFRVNDLLQQFQHFFTDAGIPTTRDLHQKKNTVPVGSITLTTLALVTLIASDVDIDTFVWAATSLTSTLEQKFVHHILAKMEKAENKEENKKSQGSERNKSNSNNNNMRNRRKRLSSGEGQVSVYLERLRKYVSKQVSKGTIDSDETIALYKIIKMTDELLIETRKSDSVHEIVTTATTTLTTSSEIGSQGSIDESFGDVENDTKKDYGGYKVLENAAKKVDMKSKQRERRERKNNPKRRVRVHKVDAVYKATSKNNDDSDLDDFAELFSSDIKNTKKKRRTSLGIRTKENNQNDENDDGEECERVITNLNDDINEFCHVVRRSLGDYASGILNKNSKHETTSYNCPVLATVHCAKGSTFDHVFLCGVNKYTFPKENIPTGIGIGIEGPCAVDIASDMDPDGMDCQEERRVFFVAQTRAVKQFVCTYSAERATHNSPKDQESRFISEMVKGVSNNEVIDAVESFVKADEDAQTISSSLMTGILKVAF